MLNWKTKKYHVLNNGYSPLFVAIESQSVEIVKYLVERGVDIKYKTAKISLITNKLTPLIIASRGGNLEIIKTLVEAGAELNIINRILFKYLIPLHFIFPN